MILSVWRSRLSLVVVIWILWICCYEALNYLVSNCIKSIVTFCYHRCLEVHSYL